MKKFESFSQKTQKVSNKISINIQQGLSNLKATEQIGIIIHQTWFYSQCLAAIKHTSKTASTSILESRIPQNPDTTKEGVSRTFISTHPLTQKRRSKTNCFVAFAEVTLQDRHSPS